MTRTRYAPDRGLTARMGLTMFLLGLVFVGFVAALVGILTAVHASGGAIIFFPVLLAAVGTGSSLFSFISPLPYPLNLVGPIIAVWFALGIAYLVYLKLRAPEALRGMATAFDEE